MTFIRIATYAQNQTLQNNIAQTQNEVNRTAIQVSSGKVTQEYSGIASRALEVSLFEEDRRLTEQYAQNITVTRTRLQTVDSRLESLTDLATQLLGQIQSALNGNNLAEVGFDSVAKSYQAEVVALLNGQQEGRYLFSGNQTDTLPVDVTDPAYTPQAGLPGTFTADTDYFQADSSQLSIRIDESTELQYGIAANEPAFEQLLRAISYMEYAGANQDKSVLTQSFSLIQSSLDGLSDLRSTVGAQLDIIDRTEKNHKDFGTYISNAISTIEDVDIAAATSRLSFDQVQLQASYISLQRVTSLTLLDFIR
ncbi:flagellin [Kiloniella sp. b19]|uniref:flagellin n=1 Tax=Kiloniella sp. GXU_MW_B19 TaxID=3141326 RepID=UPI0031D8BD83